MDLKVFFLSVVVCLLPLKAFASTPKLSGNYALSLHTECQVNVTQVQDGGQSTNCGSCNGDVLDIQTNDDGKFQHEVGVATFSPSTGQVTVNASGGQGPVLFYNPKSPPSDNFAAEAISGTDPYSNTSSTFTINGDEYNAAYGDIVKGIAHYVSFERIDTQKQCVEWGTAVRQ